MFIHNECMVDKVLYNLSLIKIIFFMCLRQKAQQRLKLPVAPSLQRLQVFRWANQALATPPDHPILPLVWQKFLQLYLRQPGPEYGYSGCLVIINAEQVGIHGQSLN